MAAPRAAALAHRELRPFCSPAVLFQAVRTVTGLAMAICGGDLAVGDPDVDRCLLALRPNVRPWGRPSQSAFRLPMPVSPSARLP
jgi:hypothetical protein